MASIARAEHVACPSFASGAEYMCDSTGAFVQKENAEFHPGGGAMKVIAFVA